MARLRGDTSVTTLYHHTLMRAENLATYLNDHLAGSVLALELLQHLADASESGARENELRRLHDEIKSDQMVLTQMLERLVAQPSVLKKAGAWMAEKLAHLKLRLTSAGADSALGRLEAFEMLSLGIEGKKGLWRSLQAVQAELPVDPPLDLEMLSVTAALQREKVEALRLESTIEAFGPHS